MCIFNLITGGHSSLVSDLENVHRIRWQEIITPEIKNKDKKKTINNELTWKAVNEVRSALCCKSLCLHEFSKTQPSMNWMLLKRGAGSGERGAGSMERGTEVWERLVSGNLHKNPKWRSKKRERERRRQRKEFVPWLKSGGDEIANQTHIFRLRFEQVVCFFDIQPVSFTIW